MSLSESQTAPEWQIKPAEQLETMVALFSPPDPEQETGSRLRSGAVSSRRSTLSVSCGRLSDFSSSSAHSDISGSEVTSHPSTQTKTELESGRGISCSMLLTLQKVQESSGWKVPFQHFVVTRPQSARSTALFYWTTQEKQLRFMSHVAACTNILLS